MTWSSFIWFALVSVGLWIIGAWAAWKDRSKVAYAATVAGLLVFLSFIIAMWMSLERPPLRTMGETRLWYSFFLPLAGIIVYGRWKYKWILSFSTLLSVVFICVNLFKPEIHNKTLMPALQSPWFAPHVIVYMFAYALLGAATVMAIYLLFFNQWKIENGKIKKTRSENNCQLSIVNGQSVEMAICDNLVYVGLSFMTFGMLFGALWAKEAWGHYWAWDPKETWAAITWFAYLAYIHYRLMPKHNVKIALWMLLIAFVLLQMCWWGINYLPSAQGTSVHTYMN
ncbi:MAG: cytochrome c biogenesis protein CcsA [Bacteroidales bacterium]